MSKKDQEQVFASARKQGWTTVVGSAGHMEMWCPCHGICVTKASTTPGDIRGTERLKQDLAKHGWLEPGEYKEKLKRERAEAKKERKAERLTAAATAKQEQEESEVSDVPQIGDVARVTKRGGEVDPQELMPANDILKNLPLAAELLWEKVIEKIKEDGPEPLKIGAVAGYRWTGSRDGAMRELWPSIPRGETGSNQSDPRRVKLAIYLRQTQNMICLDRGDRTKMSVWWVRAEFSKQAPGSERELTTWTERRLTTAEAGEDREPGPVTVRMAAVAAASKNHDQSVDDGDVTDVDTTCPECSTELPARVLDDHRLEHHFVCPECGRRDTDLRRTNLHRSKQHGYRAPNYEQNRRTRELAAGLTPVDPDGDGFYHCPDCGVTTQSIKRFGTHRRAYLNQSHPEARFRCRRCKEVLNDRDELYDHYQVVHNESVSICKGCGEALLSRQALNDHKVNVHGVVFTKKGEIWPDEPPARTDRRLEKTINSPTIVFDTESEETIIDPLTAIQRILTENAELKANEASLSRHLEELERELSETRREYERLLKLNDTTELQEKLVKVTEERDQLKATLDGLRAAFSGLNLLKES